MTKNKAQPKQRHVPERTCVACRMQRHKRDLLRIVYTSAGEVMVDETGKQNGRGAYLCRQQSCWEKAFKHGSLDRALRTTLTAEMLDALRVFAATLPVILATPQMPTAPVDDETVVA